MIKSNRKLALFLLAAISFSLSAGLLSADDNSPNAGETLKWQVISGGGTTNGTSASYKLSSTVGQTAAGSGSSASYKLNQGFQQNFSAACACGDANGSGGINISDVVYLINYIFSSGPAPNPICRGDANGSGAINISDAVLLVNYIFSGGIAPHCP